MSPSRDPLADSHGDEEFETDLAGATTQMEGQYIVRCDDVKSDVSKAGNDMWVWGFTVVSDTKGNDQHAGFTMNVYTALSEAAMWKVEETLCALGLAEPGSATKFKRSQAVGRMALASVVMQEDQNGRMRPSIDILAPHPRGAGYRGESAPRPTNPAPQGATRAAATAPTQRPIPTARPVAPPAKPVAAARPVARPPIPKPAPAPDPAEEFLGTDDPPAEDEWGNPTEEEAT